MQLMVTLLGDTYVRGWMTVSGCTRAGEVRVITPPRPAAAATPVSIKVFYFRLCFACMASIVLD